jgi:plasmid replication initiation protein
MAGRQEDRAYLVKAEGNFEDHPFFTVGNQRSGEGILRYSSTIRTRDGQELNQTWTVRAVQGLGLPGTLDQDVYVALLQIIDRQGGIPEDGWISFSLYELMRLLRRTHGGRDYRQIKESLERLAGTIIQSKNAFYRKSTKSYLDDTFHLLERVQHSESTDGSGKRGERTWVKLSEYFVDSYNANYLKGLDADFYWSLNSSVAKRLYRFVDKKRNQQRRWEVDLFSLRDRIPLSSYKYPSKIREKLEPAHEELTHKGFFERVTYRKTAEGDNLVCYEIAQDFSNRRPAVELEATPEVRIAVERLKAEGLRSDAAEDLVHRHGPERCLRYAEAVTFRKNVRNRAGWVRKAIENGYELDVPDAVSGTVSETKAATPTPRGETVASARASGPDAGSAPFVGPQMSLAMDSENPGEDGQESSVEDQTPPPLLQSDPAAEEAWRQLVSNVEERIDVSSLRVWFKQSFGTDLKGRTLSVAVPNTFAKEYIETRFGGVLDQAAASLLEEGARVEVVVGERVDEAAGQPA